MAGSAEILAAFRELSHLKQITREELHGLLQDGIHAALAKKHGANVQAEVEINEEKGAIRIVLLKTVVDDVTDPAREVPLEEARFMDPEFQVGDVMEIEVDFNEFGRTAVQAAKQRIVQRVREGERSRIRDEFAATSSLGKSSRSSAVSWSSCSISFAKRKPSSRIASRTIGNTTIRANRCVPSSSGSRIRQRVHGSS